MEHNQYYYWQRMKAEFSTKGKGCNVSYGGGELALDYHDTRVASLDFTTGRLTLEHGGWRTHYTKERINRFCDVLGLSVGVFRRRKRFIITHAGHEIDWGHIDDSDTAHEVGIDTGFMVAP